MVQLVIDAGNSRLKWNTATASELQGETRKVAWDRPHVNEQLNQQWRTLTDIDAVWLANVAGQHIGQAISHWCEQQWGLQPQSAHTQSRQCGVTNGYRDYRQLGVDRWLCLVAARQLLPGQNVCIVDCGTAITIDVLLKDGSHAGGAIAPGIDLMQQTLSRQTDAIAIQSGESSSAEETARILHQQDQLLGTSTEECVGLGIVRAVIGYIQSMIEKLQQTYSSQLQIVLTGGAAEGLQPCLPQPSLYYPDLVLQGLITVMVDQ